MSSVSSVKRLPDHTRASELILHGHDYQAMHAMVDLLRRVAELLVEALDDSGELHDQAHRVDGKRRDRKAREYAAKRVARLEAIVDLLGGTL